MNLTEKFEQVHGALDTSAELNEKNGKRTKEHVPALAVHIPSSIPSSGAVTFNNVSNTDRRPAAAAACTGFNPSPSATLGSAPTANSAATSAGLSSAVFGWLAAMCNAVIPPGGREEVGAPAASAALSAPGDPDAAANDAAPTPLRSVAAALAPISASNVMVASAPARQGTQRKKTKKTNKLTAETTKNLNYFLTRTRCFHVGIRRTSM